MVEKIEKGIFGSKPSDAKTRFKLGRLKIVFFLLLFVSNIAVVTIGPWVQNAQAQNAPTDTVLNNYEIAQQFLALLNQAPVENSVEFFASYLLVKTYDANNNFNVNNSAAEAKFAVSPSVGVKYGGKYMSAEKAIKIILGYNYKNGAKEWLDKFYDTSKPIDPSVGIPGKYFKKYNNVSTPAALKVELNKFITEVKARPSFGQAWAAYQRRQVKAAFEVCYRLRDGKDPSKEDSYDFNSGYNKDKGVEVGYVVEDAIAESGGYDDGLVSCGTLMQGYLLGNYFDDSVTEDFEKDVKAQAIRDVIGKTAEDRAKFIACVAGADAGLLRLPIGDLLVAVSEWLVDEDPSANAPIKIGGIDATISASTMMIISACLLDKKAFGDELQAVLDKDFVAGDETQDDVNAGDTALLDDCKMPAAWDIKNWIPGALDWFGCTVAKAMIGVVEAISSALEKVLATEDLSENTAVQVVWRNFLTIANILFVIAFLLMIISSALNVGIFDAYTIKKLLPRIIIAVILANLSLPLMGIAIKITNALGQEMNQIILSPVSGEISKLPAGVNDIGAGAGAAIAAALSAAITALVISVSTGSIFVLVPAVMTAVFALLVGVVVVIIRRIIILLLVVVAPIAVALWIIPGTEGWAKRWYKTFMQMLLMYPIIMAMIAAGQFTALLILNSAKSGGSPDANPGFFEGLSALLAIVLPLFLLPTIFKLASSTLSNITGMLNNKGKGIFDKGANWGRERAGTTKRAFEKKERKESGLGDRKRGGTERLIHRGQRTRWDKIQSRATGGKLGQGVGDADFEVMKAHEAQEAVRGQSARDARYAAELKAGTLALGEAGTESAGATFEIKDAAGNIVARGIKKDKMLEYGASGHTATNEQTGKIAADGSEGSQRAILHKIGSQGLIEPYRNLIQHADNLEAASPMGKSDPAVIKLRGAIAEAKDQYSGTIAAKAPDLVKGPELAFSAPTTESMLTWDETTAKKAVEYWTGADPKGNNPGTWSTIDSSLDNLLQDPYNHGKQSAKVRKAMRDSVETYANSVTSAGGTLTAEQQKVYDRIVTGVAGKNKIDTRGNVTP